MGRYQALACAIHQQIHLLEQRLADQDFIAQDQRVIAGAAVHDFKAHALRQADIALAAIGKLNCHPVIRPNPKLLQQRRRDAKERTAPVSTNASASITRTLSTASLPSAAALASEILNSLTFVLTSPV